MYFSGNPFGDIVISHREGVVVNSDADEQAAYDQMQEQFGDIVIAADEGVVVNDVTGAEGFDMQQDQFGLGEVIRKALYRAVGGGPFPYQDFDVAPRGPAGFAGDDGVGFAQAQRLKQRMLASPRRVQVTQGFNPASVGSGANDTDDDDGGLGKFSFKRLFKPPRAIRKFQFGRFLGRTGLPFVGGGVLGIAARKGIGSLTRKRRGGPGTAPAPTEGPATDVIGQPAPSFPTAPSPIGPGGGSASEDVAAQVQAANGGDGGGMEQASLFGGLDPKMVMIGGGIALALFAFSRGGKRGRRR